MLEIINPGVRYDKKKNILVYYEDFVEVDKQTNDDQRNFHVLRDIADSLDKKIAS